MIRKHRNSRPVLRSHSGLQPREVQRTAHAQEQAQVFHGLPGRRSQDQNRLDNWIAGVDKFDQKIRKWAARPHTFNPVREGLDLCARCDQPQDACVTDSQDPLHVDSKELQRINSLKWKKKRAGQ